MLERPRWQWWPWIIGAIVGAAAVAVAVGLTLALVLGGGDGGPSDGEEEVLPYAAVVGSISVALQDGQPAAAVIFEDKCDAYLVVGQEEGSPRLTDGDYFFQVTDVSGETLLSSDEVRFRQLRVADGAIEDVSGQGNHAVGSDSLSGGATVQFCPFGDSPDSSGIYGVWVTRVEDFEGDVEAVDSSAADSHGFLAARSARALFAVGPAR
ncbi:MAG: hypothetical protein JSU97_08265 [Dehalococcoidia bacterium]|nr:MAG: hypothetical protein JSU97_08265 [Dehalococcoidia bacterium]